MDLVMTVLHTIPVPRLGWVLILIAAISLFAGSSAIPAQASEEDGE
jgi:hypothetical protein